ncbi:YczE/YyaS/YitT family protein [Metabacillus halosaccharovorans]|uniref:YczE/YyaS/YitT family protein n=1 Tax=Metabacillus halosaccharovorans TaxID=930124 RepID=UPI001C1FCE29|nr:YitT family protein [Metabacillus halosaccharovorans]MBU7593227.1 YitT family protein [Metabacillus halosaccharovorans]
MSICSMKKRHPLQWLFFMIGISVMSFGIVLMIKADLGSAPWDVLHIGLFEHFGLTIGTWSIIMGFFVLGSASLLTKSLPQTGAFLNMLLVGIFIDMYLLIPFLQTPDSLGFQIIMLIIGIVVIGYGMGLYIAADCGIGPRDSLMIALVKMTGMKIQWIRLLMEIVVLSFGWLLGGPVFIGTIIFCLTIGHVVGLTLPHCQRLVDRVMNLHVSASESVNHRI